MRKEAPAVFCVRLHSGRLGLGIMELALTVKILKFDQVAAIGPGAPCYNLSTRAELAGHVRGYRLGLTIHTDRLSAGRQLVGRCSMHGILS